jgi:hypothetical protein
MAAKPRRLSTKPNAPRNMLLSASLSAGMWSGHRCGHQLSDALSLPERRGWTFTVQAAAQAELLTSASWTVVDGEEKYETADRF